MKEVEVILISGRTTEQGTSLEVGKTSEQYFNSAAVVELSVDDSEALGLKDGDSVEVKTFQGSVIVNSRKSDSLNPGLAFFPYGPWANRIFCASTGGTGMPLFKGVDAKIRPVERRPLKLMELVKALRSDV